MFDHYERFGDARRTIAAFPPLPGGKGPSGGSPWLRKELWHVFVFECTSGGRCGLSQMELHRLYRYTKTLESSTGDAPEKPFTDTFKSANRFVAAARRFKRSVITPLEWENDTMDVEGRKYHIFFRNAFDAAQEMVIRGFGIMIRIKHRPVSSDFLLAATSYVHQSFHEESEHEVSFPAVSCVLLSHWMARRFQRIYPDISGYIPDPAEKSGF